MSCFVYVLVVWQIIIAGLRRSCAIALEKIQEIAVKTEDGEAFRRMLETCAGTALNSKLIARYKVRAIAHSEAILACVCVFVVLNGGISLIFVFVFFLLFPG